MRTVISYIAAVYLQQSAAPDRNAESVTVGAKPGNPPHGWSIGEVVMALGFPRMSLLWKILLSTSIALSILFAVTLVIVERHVLGITYRTLEQEINGSFQAYDSLWRARADKLATVSLLLSRMSDVRRIFSTGDQATIRDSFGELLSTISEQEALFEVTNAAGGVIASLGRGDESLPGGNLHAVKAAALRFPAQSAGFLFEGGRLYQVMITPVYVDSAHGPTLLNILVAGYPVDSAVAQRFKEAAGGSDFAFLSGGRVIASTLPDDTPTAPGEYASITRPLPGVDGSRIGELRIYRSFKAARQNLSALLRQVYIIWLAAVLVGLALTWWLARGILRPVEELDRAAVQIAGENYDVRVSEDDRDELGRLGRTFNAMCVALERARANLIRQERLLTIGRLSSSIIHDLRNPLAAIYGGAEMLVDLELPPAHVKRLASNIYHSAGRLRSLLSDLAGVTRGKARFTENCNLREVIGAACDTAASAAEDQGVSIVVDLRAEIELPLERARVERVFINLINNALEVMPDGGSIRIAARESGGDVLVEVEDTGPGIPLEIRGRLFEPFATAGKKDGLGLGLALSRQTVLDHGGDMWAEPSIGARFVIRLPLKSAVPA
jgi:signal transduction histidine kinase